MKTYYIIIVAVFLFLSSALQAQEKPTKKEKRAAKKALEIAQSDSLRVIQEIWAENKTFVLEAQQVFNKRGEVFQLSPSTNFVYFDMDKAIVQLSFNGLVGWNGVGGITIKGNITKYKYDAENKNKPIYIEATLQGSDGFQDIFLWISSSGQGEAQVNDMRGNRIRFTGHVLSLKDSRVYIGSERF